MASSAKKFTTRFLLTITVVSTTVLFAPHFMQQSNTTDVETRRVVFARPQPNENNIFFFEGTCARTLTIPKQFEGDTRLRLDVKQACAIESTARANPYMNIFLYSSCPISEESVSRSSVMVQEIFRQHKNVFVWHQSLESLFKGTKMEGFFRSKKMFNSPFKTQSSNVLRVLLLKKFGGTYLDLDFISLRPISMLDTNFACFEIKNIVNGAALRFGLDPVGRKVVDMFMKEIIATFNGKIWGHNGPRMATRVLKRLCRFEKNGFKFGQDCGGFTLYKREVFYPLLYDQWKQMYAEKYTKPILRAINSSTGVHLWNSMVMNEKSRMYPTLFRDSNQTMMVLQREYCPISQTFNPV